MQVELVNKDIQEDYGKELLRERGVEDVDLFINPNLDCLEDWKNLENIDKGIELIRGLREYSEIGLIIDPDVDGFSSATIVYQYLKELFPTIKIKYFLHQGKKHGVDEFHEELKESDFDLFIVPDAGSNDGEYIKEWNFPVLVIDHHEVDIAYIPPNMTLINNQISPLYKNKSQSGAGIVYQFCRGLDEVFEVDFSKNYLDLAAIGSISDMMSGLELENQYIWKKGLSKINNAFLKSLVLSQAYGITGNSRAADFQVFEALNPTSISFYVAPLINAMIRVGTDEQKEKLFKAFLDGTQPIPSTKRGSKGEIVEISEDVIRECNNAKARQNRVKDKATQNIRGKIEKNDLLHNEILFIELEENDDFPPEMNGLIATSLVSQYGKPTMIGRKNQEGDVSGSIRGKENTGLESFKGYLESTGKMNYVAGHPMAAGFSIPENQLTSLLEQSNKDLAKLKLGEGVYKVNFKRFASDSDILDLVYDLAFYKDIWSHMNKEPLICIEDIYISPEEVQVIGRNQDTLKFLKNGVTYIQFKADKLIQELSNCEDLKLTIVGTANVNVWNQNKTPQIMIKDYSSSVSSIFDF